MPQDTEVPVEQGDDPLKTVMIVEDDVHIGAFLVEVITQETPYHALLIGNGNDALAAVNNLKPSLFILDYHLPGMNGLELYDHIHDLPDMLQVPAIMMSARLPRQELEERSIVGINKPFELDDFLQTVRKLLD
jgi:CheY-like chemotaxis protein